MVPVRTTSLGELVETYLKYNKNKDSRDIYNIKKAFSLLIECYPNADTVSFSALKLIEFQKYLISKEYARDYCNKLITFIRGVFKWGMIDQLVSPTLAFQLECVPTIRYGETKESIKRTEVPISYVETLLPYLPEQIADMLRLQLLTAMRPSEVFRMTWAQIKTDYDGENWLYLPYKHKTSWRGKDKVVILGNDEQEILNKYKVTNSDEYLFLNLKGNPYTTGVYDNIIRETIEKNKLPKFTPYQLRHTKLTDISLEFGRDTARAVAGHTSEITTSIYDHADLEKAKLVVKKRNTPKNNYELTKLPMLPYLKVYRGEEQL
jgi:integrase